MTDRISTIQCDTEGCSLRITVPNDIDESQAAAIARAAGWEARMGSHRWYHVCVKHRPVTR